VGADGFSEALESMADAHEFKLILMTGMQGVRLRSEIRLVHTMMKPFDLEVLGALLVRYCGRPNRPAVVVGA